MRRRDVNFSPEARQDLVDMLDNIADAVGVQVAINYIDRLESFLLGMDLASERGTLRDDIRPGLRIVGFEKKVTVAFSVDPEVVTILRVLPGRRDWQYVLSDNEGGAE